MLLIINSEFSFISITLLYVLNVYYNGIPDVPKIKIEKKECIQDLEYDHSRHDIIKEFRKM